MKKNSSNSKQLDYLAILPNLVNIFIVVLDREGRIAFINKKACEILGLPREQAEGRDWFSQFIPEDQRPEVRRVFDQLMAGEIDEVKEHTNQILASGRKLRMINWHNAYIRNPEGVIQGTVSAGTDITEREAMGAALAASEQRLRSIFKAVPAGMGLVVNRIFMEVNDMILAMSGYSREELLGKSSRILYPSQEEFEFVGKVKYAQIRDRGIGTVNTLWQKKSGGIINVLLSSVPLDPADFSKGVTFSALDITDLKRSHEALKREIELVTRIAETSPVGIMQINMDGFVVFANRRAEEMSGKIRDELVGLFMADVFNFVSDDPGKNIRDDIFSIAHLSSMKSPVYGLQYTVRMSDNREMTISVNITPLLSENNGFGGCVVAIEDISERRRMENEIMRTEKLESLGILAGGIAHDFRNLMEGLFGSIEMARISGHLDEKADHYLGRAMTVFERAKDLTDQLLTFSKGGVPEQKSIDIKGLTQEIAVFCLSGSPVRHVLRVADNIWNIMGDKNQISQVFSNILINARQAMDKGGVVTLSVRNRLVSEEAGYQTIPGLYVEICIRDTGPGIPQENLGKIFDPFFTTKKGGSGLGLAICYSIIKRHGGHISVSSQPGEGTMFEILLPATELKEGVEMESPAASVRGSGRILILDDEQVILEVTSDMMKNLGYQVVTAVEGREAVETFRKAFEENGKFDLVILDLTIPGGLGGKDIIESLRSIDPGIKALVSSGYSDDPVLAKPGIYGFSGAIAKPYRLKDLAGILQKYLTGR